MTQPLWHLAILRQSSTTIYTIVLLLNYLLYSIFSSFIPATKSTNWSTNENKWVLWDKLVKDINKRNKHYFLNNFLTFNGSSISSKERLKFRESYSNLQNFWLHKISNGIISKISAQCISLLFSATPNFIQFDSFELSIFLFSKM